MNQLEKKLLLYKTNNINSLDIYLGSFDIISKDITLFNKEITKDKYNTILNNTFTKNYKHKICKKQIYSYNQHYLDISTNEHISKNNIKKTKYNNNIIMVSYHKKIEPYHSFSCKSNYTTCNYTTTEFKINNEISLFFNEDQSNICFNILVDHNIDNTIKLLHTLLENYSQYL